jgi:hypothetical protein
VLTARHRSSQISAIFLIITIVGVALGIAVARSNQEQAPISKRVVSNTSTSQAKADITEAACDLNLRQIGKYHVGRTGRAEVTLLAKGRYHVNQEYPLSFRVRISPGINYSQVTVTKDFAHIEPNRAVLPIEFAPKQAGHAQIAGTLKFSVCNNQRCLIEKRDLELDISIQEVK